MENINSRYRFEIYDSSQNLVADVTTRNTAFTFRKRKNRSDAISMTFDIENMQRLCQKLNITMSELFALNRNELRIYRDDALITAGQINYRNPKLGSGGNSLTINAVGWLELFAQRFTGISASGGDWYYTNTDAGQIAWDLIDTSQQLTNGDFGITQGNIQASVNRDRTDYDFTNILDALIALTEVENGFDMEITPEKVFNVYYPRIGQNQPNIVLTYPGNIDSISFSDDGKRMANKVHVIGSGMGSDRVYQYAEDTVLGGVYGLREKKLVLSSVTLDDTLTEHANEELTEYKIPFTIPAISLKNGLDPRFGTYNIGDTLPVVVDEYFEVFGEINGDYSIEEISLTLDSNGREGISLGMSR